jgi:hypothetical protein
MPAPPESGQSLIEALAAHQSDHQARFLAAVADPVSGQFDLAAASSSADAVSFDEVGAALQWRARHFDAALAVADELIAQLNLALQSAPDAASRNRLQVAISGLQQFKEDLRTQKNREAERGLRLRDEQRQTAKTAERKRLVQEALQIRLALRAPACGPTAARLSDGIQGRMQAALLAQAAARGARFDPPGGPLGLDSSLAIHLGALMQGAAIENATAGELLQRIKSRLAVLG